MTTTPTRTRKAAAKKAEATPAPIAVVQMELDKETPGTYRFRAVEDDAAIVTVYVGKEHFESTPDKVTLTLS